MLMLPWRKKWPSCEHQKLNRRGASRHSTAEQTTWSSSELRISVKLFVVDASLSFSVFVWAFFFLIFVLFCFSVESDKLVHHILSDLHTTKKKKSRVILRMLPVSSLVASLDVHMRLNWCRIERCRRTVSRGVVESSEHSHDWSSKIVLLKWAIIWYWCIMTTTVKPLGFFFFLLSGNWNLQSFSGRHGEISDHFPGALVQNSKLCYLPDCVQGSQQQPQQARRNHQIYRR